MINKIINSILDEFHEKGVNYCILRNYEGFDFQNNKDLDLLIEPKNIKDIHNILTTIFEFHGMPWTKQDQTRMLRYTFTVDENRQFTLDLSKYITIKTNPIEKKIPFSGTKVFIDSLNVRTKTSKKNGNTIKILGKDDELLLLANHCLVKPKNKYIKKLKKDLFEMGYLENPLNDFDPYEIINFLMKKMHLKKQSFFVQIIQFPTYIFKYKF